MTFESANGGCRMHRKDHLGGVYSKILARTYAILLSISIILSFGTVISVQAFDQITTGDACSYFGESVPERVSTFSSDDEAEDVIDRIVAASGLTQNFNVHAAGVPNAAAVVRGGKRYILYNQYFMQNMQKKTGSEWSSISIMAHEIGHHLNGHTLDRIGSRPKTELEADFYSGFIIQRLGGSLDDARLVMRQFGSSKGSSTHPPKHDRLAAITSGWTKACQADPECKQTNSITKKRRTRTAPSKANSCEFARDGECDEPGACKAGTDTADCKKARKKSETTTITPPPLPRQKYCCDVFGRKWCAIQGPFGAGAPCFCAGVPGAGATCF